MYHIVVLKNGAIVAIQSLHAPFGITAYIQRMLKLGYGLDIRYEEQP
jgi:hypothetical protein